MLRDAALGGPHPPALPLDDAPRSVADAHAIQALLVAMLGRTVAGWKVATTADGVSTWGAIFAGDCFASPATIEAARMPMLGVEGEIAFRFKAGLPARTALYSRAEIEAVLDPFPAIEIVDTRFARYADAPALDRLADRMSNGGFVFGTSEAGGAALDLSQLHVALKRDGETLLDRIGGHGRGDPLLPVIEFVHAVQAGQDFSAGQFITAGTLTGMVPGERGQRFDLGFETFGSVAVTFI